MCLLFPVLTIILIICLSLVLLISHFPLIVPLSLSPMRVRIGLISPTLISPTLISPTLISPTIDQFVSFRLLTEVCTIREYEVIQIIFYRFMHNNGLGRHYTIVCADTPDKYSSRVMEFDEFLNLAVSLNNLPGPPGRCSSSSKLCHGHLC